MTKRKYSYFFLEKNAYLVFLMPHFYFCEELKELLINQVLIILVFLIGVLIFKSCFS